MLLDYDYLFAGNEKNNEDCEETTSTPENSFSYSMEKFMDPNRPFKCDVCKESFTQKNILLVHYNSVSHLHRLKKSMECKDLIPTPEKSPTKGSALEALLGNITSKKENQTEEDKPYICNICKVSYSQGSNLDIHIRSALHQSKASKLQELIISGQIDLRKPLIEQPDSNNASNIEQQKKMLTDMLSPKSLNSTGSSGSPSVVQRSSSPKSPTSSPLTKETDQESLSNIVKNLPFLENAGDKASPVLKNLLSNYGLDMVMQELNKKKEQEDNTKLFPCPICKKEFGNIGVLKLHMEDLHKDIFPPEILEQYIEKLKAENNEVDDSKESSRPPSVRASTPQHQQPPPQPQQPPVPPNLAEMQEALQRAMMMNPMMMQMAQLQGLNPMAAMNLYPPLIPPGLLQGQQPPPPPGLLDPKFLALMAASKGGGELPAAAPPVAKSAPPTPVQSAPQQQPESGKRARTRISDDQLRVLRSHFDINNSPTEDTLNLMARQTGLPLKVIKHWFRNTLFKERQKNKDSPYNFNNPPSTKLNLEEYEKSGEAKITPLKPEEQGEYVQNELIKAESEIKMEMDYSPASKKPRSDDNATNIVPNNDKSSSQEQQITLSKILGGSATGGAKSNLLPNFPAFPPGNNLAPMPSYLTNLANRMSTEMNNSRPLSPQSGGSSSGGNGNCGGKRANRTRFTDYQIKVLQEFFENNAYPKDDDLEYLSKLLGLSPRVIVVWFQNARQKARKIYENQPASEGGGPSPTSASPSASTAAAANNAAAAAAATPEDPDNTGRFTRTPGLNYQCKKCLLVFQRYYELIRHQKQHCYKEEDAKRSAQAQKAAAQAASQFAGQLGNHTNSEDSNNSNDRSITSPVFPNDHQAGEAADKEDLVAKFIGNNPFLQYPPSSPFGILQQQVMNMKQQQNQDDDVDSISSTPSSSKRKLSEEGTEEEELIHREKRLRTSITQDQLDFLLVRYHLDSNPSTEYLEQLANETGLRKSVILKWFINTKARERKGLYVRPNFSKKCPLCKVPSFKTRTALECHLTTYHANETVDIENIPNEEQVVPTEDEEPEQLPVVSDHLASLIPNSTNAYDLQNTMRKYYEDTMKRFMNDIHENKEGSSGNNALDLTSSDMGDNLSDQGDLGDGENGNGSKRFRTQMSNLQIKMMKAVFELYKTPTMTECSGLGREIGLQKRVVQVWFQNARAKEKRAKLQLQQATGNEPDPLPTPDECTFCNFKYTNQFNVQDHIFSKSHLDKIRIALESGAYEPEAPGHVMTQAAVAITESPQQQKSIQMLQLNNHELLGQNPRMLMQV